MRDNAVRPLGTPSTRIARLAMVLLACLGCGRDEAGSGAVGASATRRASTHLKIAVIPKATNHEYWKSVHAGALEAEAELDDVVIVWKGPVKESDREQQINIVESFINARVDGIVLAPLDEKALIRPVHDAMASGVPVVIIDSGLDAQASDAYVSFVATDNEAGGQLAARRMGELLDGNGRVLVLRYLQGSDSTTRREEGFLAGLREMYPGIEIVSSDQYAGPTTESALATAEALLDRFPDVDGIFTPCEPPVLALLLALEAKGLVGNVKVVGFDASDRLVEAMKQGHLHGLVLQDPVNIGYLGVKTIVRHLRNQNVEHRIDTGIALATPENMNEPRIAELLHPLARAGQP